MNFLVSIIIPTYNRAHLINETLDSIRIQSYQNWECIVVDDGSTDNTDQIVNQYSELDNRFQYYKRPTERQKGANSCRNYGFELSKGEFINWFDSDDLMDKSLLQNKIDLFKNNNNLEFVICGFRMFENESVIEDNKWVVRNKENIYKKFLAKEIVLNTQVILWKKEIINGVIFDENLTRAQDLYFIFKAFEKLCLNFEILAFPYVNIRIHEETITSSYKYGRVKDIRSEIIVRKSIFLKFIYDDDLEFIKKTRNIYLNTLKKSLETKNYNIFFNEVLKIKAIGFILRVKLLVIGLSYIFFKRGLSKYSKLLKK